MDKWIVALNQSLIKYFRNEMDNYRLFTVVGKLLTYLDQLTNWYVRLNRLRLKGDHGPEAQHTSLNILFDVLLSTTMMMSCFTPFICEYIYQNLKNGINPDHKDIYADSVHFLRTPDFQEDLLNEKIERQISRMQKVIETGRKVRDFKKVSMKFPLREVKLVNKDVEFQEDIRFLEQFILEELNVLKVTLEGNENGLVVYNTEPDHKALGQALGKAFNKEMKKQIESLTTEQCEAYMRDNKIELQGHEITAGQLKIRKEFNGATKALKEWGVESDGVESLVMLDVVEDEGLFNRGYAREIVKLVQTARKEKGLDIDDEIAIFVELADNQEGRLASIVRDNLEAMRANIRMRVYVHPAPKGVVTVWDGEYRFGNSAAKLTIVPDSVVLNEAAFALLLPDPKERESVRQLLNSYQVALLRDKVPLGGLLSLTLDNKRHQLKRGEHFYLEEKDLA